MATLLIPTQDFAAELETDLEGRLEVMADDGLSGKHPACCTGKPTQPRSLLRSRHPCPQPEPSPAPPRATRASLKRSLNARGEAPIHLKQLLARPSRVAVQLVIKGNESLEHARQSTRIPAILNDLLQPRTR